VLGLAVGVDDGLFDQLLEPPLGRWPITYGASLPVDPVPSGRSIDLEILPPVAYDRTVT
jgi:hypothetical protein